MRTAPKLETRRVLLRSVRDDDLSTLFTWRNSESFRYLFHHNENIVSFDEFCREFQNDATVRPFQYVIEKRASGEVIGLSFVHSLADDKKSCFLNIFFADRFERRGYGVDVFALFCRFLLEDGGIERIYVEAFDYNIFSINSIRATGMIEVERQKNKHLHLSHRYDVLKFVGDRSLLPAIRQMLTRLGARLG